MKFRYIFKLALKNLEFRRLRSFLTLGAVAIGVGFTVFLISLGYGLQMISIEEIANLKSVSVIDVTSPKPHEVKTDKSALKRFKSLEDVSEVSPQASMGGKMKYKTSTIDGVVYGKNQDYLRLEKTNLIEGRSYSSDGAKEALVTTSALKMLGFKEESKSLGKTIALEITIPAQLLLSDADQSVEKEENYKIVGVLRDEKAPYAYIPLNVLKKQGVESYSGAKIKVKDIDRIEIVKKQIESMNYEVESTKETLEQATQLFDILKSILLGFGIIAIFVASLGVFNTLTISLLERSREIGIMKALGASGKDVQRLFLAEALCIGLIGSIEGLILAGLAGWLINLGISILAETTGNRPTTLFYAPFLFLLTSFIIALIISFFTGLYPARKAANTNALDTLRYE